VWAIKAVGRRLLGSRPCLTEALAAQWLLARSGIETVIKIGVATSDDGCFLAHAWVEHEGKVIIGGFSSTTRFVPLEPHPGGTQ